MSHQGTRRGRRPVSSRATLEEAAGQLFLEQGYAATTVENITQRAGVSRTTFFNYFDAKSDLLWADVDDGIEAVIAELRSGAESGDVAEDILAAFLRVAEGYSAAQLPLAVTQFDAMGVVVALQESGVVRFSALAQAVYNYAADRLGDRAHARALAYALVGAVLAAAVEWAGAGVTRGSLAHGIEHAVRPVCAGFARGGGDENR